jgi:hypothetical protein
VSKWQGIVDIHADGKYIAGVNVYGEVLVTATSGLDFDPKTQRRDENTPAFRLRGYEAVYKLPDLNLFDSKAEEFAGFYEQMGKPQQKNEPPRHLYTQVPVGAVCGVIPPMTEEKTAPVNGKNDVVASLQKRKRELYAEKSNLKGLFTGKRRKEIDAEMAEIDKKIKQELGIL